MRTDLTPAVRTAIKTAQAALLLSPHPVSNIVEQVVTALDTAGLLTSPEVAAELRKDAITDAADWLEGIGETGAAYLLRTCDVDRPDAEGSADSPVPYALTPAAHDVAADQSSVRLRGVLAPSRDGGAS